MKDDLNNMFEDYILEHITLKDLQGMSGIVILNGTCKDCIHYQPPLLAMIDGEPTSVTPPRCGAWFGYTQDDGWCFKGAMRNDG